MLKKSIAMIVLGLGLGLAACAGNTTPPPPCPEIQILGAASKLTRFKSGPGRDIIDMLHEDTLPGFLSGCEYNVDETGAGDLMVFLAPTIQSARGPAFSGAVARMEYFIVITDSQKNLLTKQRFPVEIQHTQNLPQVTWTKTEPNRILIPLKAGQNGDDYLIYLGLQLTQEELEYQRNHP